MRRDGLPSFQRRRVCAGPAILVQRMQWSRAPRDEDFAQRRSRNRLEEVALEPRSASVLPAEVLGTLCQRNEARVLQVRMLVQSSCRLITTHIRQFDVEKDEIRIEFDGRLERGFGCVLQKRYVVSRMPEQARELVRRLRVVVHDQDARDLVQAIRSARGWRGSVRGLAVSLRVDPISTRLPRAAVSQRRAVGT